MHGFEPVLPLLLAVVFGALIGVERQWHHKSAGIKTNTLVALGAAGFTTLSATGFGPTNNPAQLAASVVTGIGFIGAGVIIHRGASVQGVNTAATLWACASMGVAVGSRHYAIGSALFVAVILVQFSMSGLERFIDRFASPAGSPQRLQIDVVCNEQSRTQIDAAWETFSSSAGLTTERRSVGVDRWSVVFRGPGFGAIGIAAFEERLLAMPGVGQVDTRAVEEENAESAVVG